MITVRVLKANIPLEVRYGVIEGELVAIRKAVKLGLYEDAALVATDDPVVAYGLMNDHRPARFGDLFVTNDGIIHACCRNGFALV